MENLLQSPAGRSKKSILGRASSSGIFGSAPKVLKARESTQPAPQTPVAAAIPESLPASPDSKGTPSRKRNIEASKADSTRAVLTGSIDQAVDVKKLQTEIVDQKRTIAELTAQKEKLEHETSQQVFVRQMLIDSLKSEVAELKEQQHQGSQEHRVALEQAAQNLKKELEEHRSKGEKQTAKMLALEASLTLATERMSALEKETTAMRSSCAKAEERELNYGAEIEKLRKQNADLLSRVENSELRRSETMAAMNEQVDALRRQFFFSTAISIKLGQFYQGHNLNVSLTDLYERLMSLNIPFAEWPAWISKQLLSAVDVPAAPAAAAPKRQRIQPNGRV